MSEKPAAFIYIITCAIHFAAVLAVIFDLSFAFVLIIELSYYIIRGGKGKIFIKMIIISIVIGLLNLFVSGGRVVLQLGFITITEYGIHRALANAMLVFGLFLFTGNFFSQRISIIKPERSGLLGQSLQYFRYLVDIAARSKNMKMIIKKIIVIYRRGIPQSQSERKNNVPLIYILYNTAAVAVFIGCIIFLIKSNKFA